MSLVVYNTLTRKKEPFEPLHDRFVGMYVCGPTVYGDSHLGHAKSYVSFDVILRYLRFCGYRVLYVQNITDVGHLTDDADEGEDKIENQSKVDRIPPMQVAEVFTRSYFEDMDALGVLRPDISPRATGHIPEQIELIQRLLEKKIAYAVNGSVYFDVTAFPGYGKLSGRRIEDMEAGARVEVNREKRHPADFALWKKAESGHIMKWKSPWGEGFPGWHLECSAMSMKYLGESLDIHGGGLENQFPHHDCEIAQSEGSSGKPFVKYWLHNNMVTVGGKKMGKSLGNFMTLKDAFRQWDPQVVRFFILQSHYRSTLDFSNEAVEGAAKGLEKIATMLQNLDDAIRSSPADGRGSGIDLQAARTRFLSAMDDDFNTPQAVAVLFDLAREVNQLLSAGGGTSAGALQEIAALYAELGQGILGLRPGAARGPADSRMEGQLIDLLVGLRNEVRAQKLWVLSDRIRNELGQMGIVLEDKKEGTTWKRGA